jgi:hypothetical protein
MAVESEAHRAHRARTAQAAFDLVVQRLVTQFPELHVEETTQAVRGESDPPESFQSVTS